MSEHQFTGKTALITGGAKGIGRACSLRIAKAGAKVAINYLSSEADAQETARQIEAIGGTAHIVKADVSSPGEVQSMVEEVAQRLGPVDLLVNNAGVFDFAPHESVTLELWRRTLDINLTGTYLAAWAVKDGMIERKYGRIVNISSIAALRPRPMSIAYAASKAGVIALTQSLAAALAPHGVRVNAVAPGLIDTDIIRDVDPEQIERIIAQTPIPRLGEPSEIANLVYFLLSDESSFTTGQTLVASGGRVTLP